MNAKRILIVGQGSIGQRHLRLVRESQPDADIRVLRHQPGQAVPALANACLSSPEAIADFRPQLAVVANPAPFHLPAAQKLVAAGCHILMEKPLAARSAEIAPCLDQARQAGLVFQVGYNLRFLPSLQTFRRLVLEGTIGRIFSVRCEIGQYLPGWRPGTDYRQGVSARAELGGGALLEMSHELDYLRWIFGEVRWVNAWTGRLGGLAVDVEDTAHLTLGFIRPTGDEAVGALSLDFARRDTTRCCVAIGTQGSLRWDALRGTVSQYLPDENRWQEVFQHRPGRDDSYQAQWAHFLTCVHEGRAPLVSGEDGLAVVRLVEAAKDSAAQHGLRVTLNNEGGG